MIDFTSRLSTTGTTIVVDMTAVVVIPPIGNETADPDGESEAIPSRSY